MFSMFAANSINSLFRRRLTAALSLALIMGTASAVSTRSAYEAQTWVTTSSRVVDFSRAVVSNAVDDGDAISVVVNLKLRNEQQLDGFITELQRPGPAFHRWLSSEQATAHFSPSAEQAQAVVDYLLAQGF